MSATRVEGEVAAGGPARTPAVEPRHAAPVKWWAGLGAASIAFFVYLVIAWFASGDAHRTPTGVNPEPTALKVCAIIGETAFWPVLGFLLVRFVLIPVRRDGRISFDGLLVLAIPVLLWQDPLSLYTQSWGGYNAYLVNLGSWATQIPGWQAPNANRLAEPILFMIPAYETAFVGAALLGSTLMRRVRGRWPQLGNVAVVAICAAAMWTLDLVLEGTFVRTGLFNFAGFPGPRLFAGHYYQFPLYEAMTMGSMFTFLACVRFFRNDRGESLADRGLDQLTAHGWRRTAARWLALCGVVTVGYVAFYNLPLQWVGTHASWVKDVVDRSYFTDGICGPGTGYACPGTRVPIPRMHSAHLDPSGHLQPVRPSRNRNQR